MEKWQKYLVEKRDEQIPEIIDSGMKNAFKKLPAKKKPRILYAFLTAAILFFSLTAGSMYSPVIASALQSIPIVGSLFGQIEIVDDGLKQVAEDGKTVSREQILIVNGQEVAIVETIYDGSRLAISYAVEAESAEEAGAFLDKISYQINGEPLTEWGRMASIAVSETELADGKYAAAFIITPLTPFPKNFTLSIKSDQQWVPLAIQQSEDQTIIEVNKVRQNKEIAIEYKAVTIYSSSIVLTFTESQTIDHYAGLENAVIAYDILDESGQVISVIGGTEKGGRFEDPMLFFEQTLVLPAKGQSYQLLTVRPYLQDTKSGKRIKEYPELELTIDLPWKKENNAHTTRKGFSK